MKKSRILACLLALTLLLGLLPLSAMAAGTLGWRFVMYGGDNRPYCNPEDPLQTEINLEPGISHHMGFFLDGALCQPSAISVEDENIASVSPLEEGGGQYYRVEALAFGKTTLYVTVGGMDYQLPILVTLPSSGFSSSETLTEATYLTSFTFSQDNRSFYFVADEAIPTDHVTLTMYNEPTEDVTWKMASDRVIQLTVSDTAAFSEAWLNLEVTWEESGTRGYSIRLTNGIPRLVFCPLDWYEGNYVLPDSLWAYDDVFWMGGSVTGVFARMIAGTMKPLSPKEVTVQGDAVALYESGTVEGIPSYSINSRSIGTATIRVDSDTMNVSVAFPSYSFFVNRERSEEGFLFHNNYFQYRDFWLLSENGFTEAEMEKTTIDAESFQPEMKWAQRDDGNYDLNIILPKPVYGTVGYRLTVMIDEEPVASLWIDTSPLNTPAYFTLGSKTYGVGFSYDRDGVTSILEGGMCSGYTTSAPKGEKRVAWGTVPVKAGLQIVDENLGVYYDFEKVSPVSIEVNQLWIEPIFGDENTFSWSATDDVSATDNPNAILYCHEGADATALIWANVTCTVGGEVCTRDVSCIVQVIYKETQTIYLSDVQNTADLNKQLAELAENTPQNSITQIFLGDDEGNQMIFEGTVEIPDAFTGDKELILHCSNVTIKGSLNLNSANVIIIDGIDFVGEKTQGVSAIYGGTCGDIENCSFTQYDVALASDADGNLNPIRCTFVDNNIAASVDVEELQWNMSLNTWNGNLFQNNGTAVKVESFNDFLSPYQFRVTNSDFIDNGVDFDVDCPATLYFYQNFYGTTKGSAEDAKHTPPTVECDHSITKVITNPRWKAPVLAWENRAVTFSLLAEPVKANYLTADWDLPTEIVNEEADGLTLDAAAFQEPGEKTIDVVNQQQQYLGTWTFDGVSIVESGVFHAGLAVEQGENAITVTVQESEMLEAVPTLTVPCAFAYAEVRFDGKTVNATIQNGKVTFPVEAAGIYTITEAEAPAQVPETPKPSKPVTKPEISQEPETPAFSDMPVGAWYEAAVAYVAGEGILQGTGNGKFSPNTNLTRGMMMTLLARMAGVDTTGGKTWYEKALAWAVEEGISDGTHPEATITREQLATMLHRFAGEPAAEGDLSAFTDGEMVSAWAKEAVAWAVKAGILQGSGGKLRPQATATRAETAQLLWKYCTAFDL